VPAVVIAVVLVIPVMAVFEAAVRTVPIAGIEASAFVARADPMRTLIRRASPVAAMPEIAAVHWIPVTVNPEIARPGAHRHDIVARRRRRADLDANGDLSSSVMSAKQEH